MEKIDIHILIIYLKHGVIIDMELIFYIHVSVGRYTDFVIFILTHGFF